MPTVLSGRRPARPPVVASLGSLAARAASMLLPLVALASIPQSAGAQSVSFDLLVSLSADDALPSGPVRDEDLVLHPSGGVSVVTWPAETLALLTGDGGAPKYPAFNDIDALHDAGAGPTADAGLYFSLVTDEAGFLDGDVIRAGPGGAAVFRGEADFVGATGALDGNVDIDAFQLDSDGSLLFSFADNEGSSFLSGDVPGQVADGDILYWLAGSPVANILLTESQVDAIVSAALGTSTKVTDVTGLARDPGTGAILFSVQSPTPNDASVFDELGHLVAGHAEADFGFGGSPELDALSVARSRFPALRASKGAPQPGEMVTLSIVEAVPGSLLACFAAFDLAPGGPEAPGWGGLALEPDGLFAATWAMSGLFLGVADGAGAASADFEVPAGLAPTDFVLQPLEVGLSLRLGNPLVLETGQ